MVAISLDIDDLVLPRRGPAVEGLMRRPAAAGTTSAGRRRLVQRAGHGLRQRVLSGVLRVYKG